MISPSYTYKAKVINVVDGDTIDVELDAGFRARLTLRLRLSRIDTPEMNKPDEKVAAVTAKNFVINRTIGKDVVVLTKKSDAFGRYLAEVYYMDGEEQINLNDELIKTGLAKEFV
jgi:micrococcal nuclease